MIAIVFVIIIIVVIHSLCKISSKADEWEELNYKMWNTEYTEENRK